jgi:hypothetical protein
LVGFHQLFLLLSRRVAVAVERVGVGAIEQSVAAAVLENGVDEWLSCISKA